MEFRIGLNLGDVMVEGEQIYGDGVNIAARLESLAEPGGINIAGTVYDQVKNKLALHYEDLGEQRVKNIAEPVRVYRVVLEETEKQKSKGKGQKPVLNVVEGAKGENPESSTFQVQGAKKNRMRPALKVALVGLVLVAAALLVLRYFSLPTPNTQPLSPSTQAAPATLALPDKPSLAVLPFINMSGDPEQEYFSDGITEDLTSDLSKISSLFVIARNSAFSYKGKSPKVQEVGKELGVRYVLEGSIRKVGDQVRITAQLIDAATGGHLWAEHYDRPLKDIFALQDEIRQKIVLALKIQLTKEEQDRFKNAPTENLEVYDYYLRGWQAYNVFTKPMHAQARALFEKAIELDPLYAAAYASLSSTYIREWGSQWSNAPATLEQALALAQKAVALDDSLAQAHQMLGRVYSWKKQYEQAAAEGERAVALAPNSADSYANLGQILNFNGEPEKAMVLLEKAMRLNPHVPAIYFYNFGVSCYLSRQYEKAISALQAALARSLEFQPVHLVLAATYMEVGREQEAQAEVTEVLRLNPTFSLEVNRSRLPFKDPLTLERYLTALRKAGLK